MARYIKIKVNPPALSAAIRAKINVTSLSVIPCTAIGSIEKLYNNNHITCSMKLIAFKKLEKYLIVWIKALLLFAIFIYLLANVLSSQLISPLYFQLVKEDKKAVARFLNKIKDLAMFPSFLEMNKIIYGNSLEQEVFSEDNKRKEAIAEHESLLQKNPKSRDALCNLYLLYYEDGNETKAEEYLNRAKEVDPSLR